MLQSIAAATCNVHCSCSRIKNDVVHWTFLTTPCRQASTHLITIMQPGPTVDSDLGSGGTDALQHALLEGQQPGSVPRLAEWTT